ncbi:MAG: hypothetical protein ACREPU_00645 [Rhodanobacteraceae bacterium]
MSEQVSNPMAEVAAMGAVAEALKELDKDAVSRVLQWAAGSFGTPIPLVKVTKSSSGDSNDQHDGTSIGAEGFDSLADLYAAAQPSVDSDRALVAGYWYQFKEGQDDFASQTINTALKYLGNGVSNITKALETLKAQTPALVMQIRKSGSSQQARKKYKLTVAGKKAVELLVGQRETK